MEVSDSWDSRDAVSAQLRKLLAICGVHVDETVHITDDELLNAVLRALLPLGLEDGHPSASLIVVLHDMLGLHLGALVPVGTVRPVIDLDGIIVGRCGDLPTRAPGRVRD